MVGRLNPDWDEDGLRACGWLGLSGWVGGVSSSPRLVLQLVDEMRWTKQGHLRAPPISAQTLPPPFAWAWHLHPLARAWPVHDPQQRPFKSPADEAL